MLTSAGHHRGEEDNFFPKLEAACGEKGLLNESVEQHSMYFLHLSKHLNHIKANNLREAFEAGLGAYRDYLLFVLRNIEPFSGTKLNSIIDSFAPALLSHLKEEIPTILSLSRFGDKIPLLKLSEVEMRKASDKIPKQEGLPFFMLNLDRTFENGMWEFWPPIPAPIRWMLIRTVARKHKGWWRFASCDVDGYPKELYATE
jgi:hypothetical protein